MYFSGKCQLGDKMRKHGNVVLTLAITWHLLDLRFADDILVFARTAAEAMALLDDLVHKL